jgi:hypothetical protein
MTVPSGTVCDESVVTKQGCLRILAKRRQVCYTKVGRIDIRMTVRATGCSGSLWIGPKLNGDMKKKPDISTLA